MTFSPNKNTVFNLYQTCRTCLKKLNDENMIKVFEFGDNQYLNNQINIVDELFLLKIKISRCDGLPSQICLECMDHLTNINTFRMVCEQAQDILEKYFKPSNYLLNTFANKVDEQCSEHAPIEINDSNFGSRYHHQESTIVKHEIDVENSSYYTIIDYANNNEKNVPIEQADPLSLDTETEINTDDDSRRNQIRNKDELTIIDQLNKGKSKTPKLDEPVLKFIKSLRQNNRSVSGLKIRNFARKYAIKIGMNKFKASDSWLRQFKKRNSISFKFNKVGKESYKNKEIDTNSLNAEDNFENVTDDVNSIDDGAEHDIIAFDNIESSDLKETVKVPIKKKLTTLKVKLEIINRLKRGANRKEIAKEYGIKKSTLTSIFKNRGHYAKMLAKNSNFASKTKPRDIPKLDEPLLKFLKHRRKKNLPLNGFILRKYAKFYAARHGMHKFKGSTGWLFKFLQRHSISLKKKNDEKLQNKDGKQMDKPNTTDSANNFKSCTSPSTNCVITEEAFDMDKELSNPKQRQNYSKKQFTFDQKLKIIAQIDKGVKRKELIDEFGIAHSTLSTIYKNRERYTTFLKNNSSLALKTKTIPTPKLDEPILKFIQESRENKRLLNGPIVRNFARKYAAKLGMNEFKASIGWLNKFKQRNSIAFTSTDDKVV